VTADESHRNSWWVISASTKYSTYRDMPCCRFGQIQLQRVRQSQLKQYLRCHSTAWHAYLPRPWLKPQSIAKQRGVGSGICRSIQHLSCTRGMSFQASFSTFKPFCGEKVHAVLQSSDLSSAGDRLQVNCQGKDEQKKSLTQQNKDRLIIVGTSKPFHPHLMH